ncbi:MAG: hypothetical protein Q8N77_00350 [Nanoarchaeota archaeon]|nr:hypothetical protein [Nanoarchaeota archaeon]
MCKQCGKETDANNVCPHCGSNPGTAEKTHKALILAIVGLVVNLLVWPGIGTLLGGIGTPGWKDARKKGIIQLCLFTLGAILSVVGIGIPIMIGVWIWALVSSIKQIKNA